ncbi:MAG: response regulator [Nitrospirae bacterium]|nr:MAG: response regulator [Nitrospirota bacterium]
MLEFPSTYKKYEGRLITILVIDDEEPIRELVVNMLQGAGYNVLAASSGKAAIAISKDYIGSIRLLLTDVVLWRENCREIARQISAARPTIKVLYMSGYVDYSIGSSSVLDSTCEFIAKPFTSDQLLDKVRAVLEP